MCGSLSCPKPTPPAFPFPLHPFPPSPLIVIIYDFCTSCLCLRVIHDIIQPNLRAVYTCNVN